MDKIILLQKPKIILLFVLKIWMSEQLYVNICKLRVIMLSTRISIIMANPMDFLIIKIICMLKIMNTKFVNKFVNKYKKHIIFTISVGPIKVGQV